MRGNGSSPHLRGTQYRILTDRPNCRFIPAPAGNTATPFIGIGAKPVHPRTCGEHYRKVEDVPDDVGSSPHLRGTLELRHEATACLRFIPAPAGNTSTQTTGPALSTVHPRTCGEHLAAPPPPAFWPVHPRTCGEHLNQSSHRPPAERFIPAPAGNTSPTCRASTTSSVHPRTCGEHMT